MVKLINADLRVRGGNGVGCKGQVSLTVGRRDAAWAGGYEGTERLRNPG